MKRLSLIACVLMAACSGKSMVAPSDTPVSVPVAGVSSNRLQTTSVKPSTSGVVFDALLGKVTITNTGDTSRKFTYIIWNANDLVNQVQQVAQSAQIPAGETREISVAFPETCGARYQRDVYLDLPGDGPYTMSDVGNYFFAAPGVMVVEGACAPPPVVPPPPARCQDREANNYTGLLPCQYGEGGEHQTHDLCLNIPGIQTSVPQGYVGILGFCIQLHHGHNE